MKYIELFAGCGGLSVGLESLDYKLIFANEISPMASETYAYNLLKEDLKKLADNKKIANKVIWITSQYTNNDLLTRLRENPKNFPKFKLDNSDLGTNLDDLKGKLIVGSIVELNKYLKQNSNIIEDLKKENIDLISGGPPCQSFSLAGLREHNNNRNTLPMDFAELVGLVNPKVALLENVSGILRAFTLDEGKHYAWFEVCKAFASKGYYPLCLNINAKYAGAAQNRPRFIMIALREDIFKNLKSNLTNKKFTNILSKIETFYNREKSGKTTLPFEHIDFYEIEKHSDLFEDNILSPLFAYKDSNTWFSVQDAIDDLKGSPIKGKKSAYVKLINKQFSNLKNTVVGHKFSDNHALRMNGPKVRMRFRLYQHLSKVVSIKSKKSIYKNVENFLKDPSNENLLQEKSIDYLIKKSFLMDDGFSLKKFSNRNDLVEYLATLATKKHTQRALIKDNPAPAALSIPDDACHYDLSLQRTLTVREMARFQSFPDIFEFRSKTTTGGMMRRFEVPQYTQVGNAVPPLLGRALGLVVQNILQLSNN